MPAPNFALAAIQWRTKLGIDCIGAALERLSGTDLPADAAVADSRLLWSLAAYAHAHPDAGTPRAILARVSGDAKQQLRAEAALALAWIGSNRAALAADRPAFLSIERDINRARLDHDWFEDLDPANQQALIWYVTDQVEAAWPAEGADAKARYGAAAAYTDRLADLVNLPDAFAEATVRSAMAKPTLLLDVSPPTVSGGAVAGNGNLPDMAFHIVGSICAAGMACDPLDASVTGAGHDQKGWETNWDGGTSSRAGLGYFLNSSTSPFYKVYAISIGAGVRGGYQKYTAALHGGRSGADQTSSVSFTVDGAVTIPTCTDPSICSTVLGIAVTANDDGARDGVVHVKAPGRDEDVPRGQTVFIDRSLGAAVLTVRMTRGLSHSGACCEPAPLSEFVRVELQEPVRTGDTSTSPLFFRSTQAENYNMFSNMAFALALKADPAGPSGLPFAPSGPLLAGTTIRSLGGSPSFDHRFQTTFLRLLFGRALRDQLWNDFDAVERSSVTVGAAATSELARSYKPLVTRQIAADRKLVALLALPELDLAIGKLQGSTDIARVVDPVHLHLIDALAKSESSGDEDPSLKQAMVLLSEARVKDDKLDALLLLLEARDKIDALRATIVTRLAALQLELVQYQ